MKQLIAAIVSVVIIASNPLPIFSAKGKITSKPMAKKSFSRPLKASGHLIVKYKKSSKLASLKGLYQSKETIEGKTIDLKLKENQDPKEAITKIDKDPNVEYVEPNYLRKASLTPNDYYYSLQWGLEKIKARSGWSYETGSTDVKVAIIDTGVDLNHPDLSAKIVAGKDVVNNDATAQDDNGHGTHVAGIAAASSNNSIGVAGVAWNVKVMPIKVLDSDGSG